MRSFLFIAQAFILTGCTVVIASTPTRMQPPQSTPTFAPAFTSTPLLLGTSTPEDLSVTPTIEGTSQADLSCKVVSQSFRNGRRFAPKERFTIGWSVRNTGTATWDPDNIEFAYYSGTKMYQFSPVQLQTSVAPHDAPVTLGADMVAPKNPGRYTTIWTLRQGEFDFCHVSVSIQVP